MNKISKLVFVCGLLITIIGLFPYYRSYIGLSLSLFPNRTTNLQVGMNWKATIPTRTGMTDTYTVASVENTVITIHADIPYTFTFDVRSEALTSSFYDRLVIGSNLTIGDVVYDYNDENGVLRQAFIYLVNNVNGKNIVYVRTSEYQSLLGVITHELRYWQDSGVLIESTRSSNVGVLGADYTCVTSDPVSSEQAWQDPIYTQFLYYDTTYAPEIVGSGCTMMVLALVGKTILKVLGLAI